MEQKRGEGNKDFKKGGGQAGPGVGALKKGAWTLLCTMEAINFDGKKGEGGSKKIIG